jgi:16S rRNA (cytidine1402-2'-O)-methyltransferase
VRALQTLRRVACIVCEDTRRTARLLARAGIERPLVSCHRFNERQRLDQLIGRLLRGDEIALVSDGGTPAVSDPGALLVAAAWDAGVVVSPIPGPTAPAALLSVSGLPADRYVFEGFLPHRAGERRRRLRALRHETRTLVLFESPQRIQATLADVAAVWGARTVVVGREMTKLHESILRGSVLEVAARLVEPVRGEFTLVVAGADATAPVAAEEQALADLRARWTAQLTATAGDRRKALREIARELGLPRAEVYRRLVEIDASDEP